MPSSSIVTHKNVTLLLLIETMVEYSMRVANRWVGRDAD